MFEVLGLVDRVGLDGKKYPNNVGNEFYLEAGLIRGGKFYPKNSDKAEELPDVDVKLGPGDHFENFIHAMRSRRIEDLNADIQEGYLSSACCQLGNISYRLGGQVAATQGPTSWKGTRKSRGRGTGSPRPPRARSASIWPRTPTNSGRC